MRGRKILTCPKVGGRRLGRIFLVVASLKGRCYKMRTTCKLCLKILETLVRTTFVLLQVSFQKKALLLMKMVWEKIVMMIRPVKMMKKLPLLQKAKEKKGATAADTSKRKRPKTSGGLWLQDQVSKIVSLHEMSTTSVQSMAAKNEEKGPSIKDVMDIVRECGAAPGTKV